MHYISGIFRFSSVISKINVNHTIDTINRTLTHRKTSNYFSLTQFCFHVKLSRFPPLIQITLSIYSPTDNTLPNNDSILSHFAFTVLFPWKPATIYLSWSRYRTMSASLRAFWKHPWKLSLKNIIPFDPLRTRVANIRTSRMSWLETVSSMLKA